MVEALAHVPYQFDLWRSWRLILRADTWTLYTYIINSNKKAAKLHIKAYWTFLADIAHPMSHISDGRIMHHEYWSTERWELEEGI